MRRTVCSALLVAAIVLVIPSSAGSVTYGLGDSSGAFAHCLAGGTACCIDHTGTCPEGTVTGFWANPLFRALTSPASQHRITETRFFVPYDALEQWNGSVTSPGCVFSDVLDRPWYDAAGRFHRSGESWDDLRASLIEAHADGLTPVVAITGYASPAARPSWDAAGPDPTTAPGWWALHCGVQGILDAVSRLPVADQPHIWEAFNEPDILPVYNGRGAIGPGACRVTATGTPVVDGAAKAACVYGLVSRQIHAFAGRAADTVIAGTLAQPALAYLAAYASQLGSMLAPAEYPAVWSVHDYGDVTDSYPTIDVSPLSAFDSALRTDTAGRATALWVTEAGTELTDQVPAPQCQPAVAPPPGRTGTLGACVDGNAAAQTLAADAFFALPEAGAAVPITHLFWYEWQAEPHWDSALTDAAGTPRAPWCAFYGSGACTGDPSTPALSSPAATG
jgi:hypothetical protein